MKTYRSQLIAKLHMLLKQQNVTENKEVIYASYGVGSSKELTDNQLSELVSKLDQNEHVVPSSRATSGKNDADVRKMRSEILSLLTHSPFIREPRKRGLGLPNDWSVLNAFIKRHGGDLLYNLNADQMRKFRAKLLAMRESGWVYRTAATTENIFEKVGQEAIVTASKTTEQSRSYSKQLSYIIMPSDTLLS